MERTRSYAATTASQLFHQVVDAIRSRRNVDHEVSILLSRLQRDEARITAKLGRPLRGLDVLEIGPGQHCERSGYLGRSNRVTGIDLDVIPQLGRIQDYVRMLRANGAGRLLKTLGRKALLVDRTRRRAWERAAGSKTVAPKLLSGDVCSQPLPSASFDVVCTWSVFEHLPDPARAVKNVVQALRPGGVSLIGVHLYTSNSGHHDIRAFTGAGRFLPLWGHLRPTTEHAIAPSSFLNRWRLAEWRRLFGEEMPGHQEFLEDYGAAELRALMTPALRRELDVFTDEELFTVDAFYAWQKPR